MSTYEPGNELFVNPYHFIRLDTHGCKRRENNDGQSLSGWIECTLTTLTPLFIPNSSNDDLLQKKDVEKNKIKSYDFFSYLDLAGYTSDQSPAAPRPVIPGSELRGAVRSAFEAVTRSCMSSIDGNAVLYKRTPVPATPGLLTKMGEKWTIQPCKRYGVGFAPSDGDPTNPMMPGGLASRLSDMSEGDKVWICPGRLPHDRYQKHLHNGKTIETFPIVTDIAAAGTGTPPAGWLEGILHKGEKTTDQHKHHESVFVRNGPSFFVTSENIDRFKENVSLYDTPPKGHSGYRDYRNVIERATNVPIYFANVNGVSYLSPAAIGREVFQQTLSKLLEQQGNYQPCDDPDDLCPACTLFGMVSDKGARAGHVRFSDAILKEEPDHLEPLFYPWVCLPELASPKPSATEFYLRRPPDAHLWNYDYAAKWQTRPDGTYKPNSLTPLVPAHYSPVILGRKFYWHKPSVQTPPRQENEPTIRIDDREQRPPCTKRNVHVRCLKPGITFTFKVYVDNVSEQELQRLLWVLSLGGRTTGVRPTHAFKIGMGKPVGLGSVQIKPTAVVRRVFSLQGEADIGYVLHTDARPLSTYDWRSRGDELTMLGCLTEVLDDFLTITDWQHSPDTLIDYPRIETPGEGESYKWFMANRSVFPATDMTPAVQQELPAINDPKLKKYRQQHR